MSSISDRVDEALGMLGRLVVLLGVALVVVFLSGILLKPILPDGLPRGQTGRVIFGIVIALALGVAHLVVGIALERARWELPGFASRGVRPLPLLGGLFGGALAVGVPAGLLLLGGQAALTTGPWSGTWGGYALEATVLVAVFALVEELVLRGYVIGLLADRWGEPVALTLTSAGSCLLALRDPSVTPLTLIGALCAGLFLGTLRLRTGSMPAAWLAHVALKWVQLAILHAPLAAFELEAPPVYRWTSVGPAWLTGGALGIETGVAASVSLLVVTFLVFRTRRPDPRRSRA